jgi:hypothetical protein
MQIHQITNASPANSKPTNPEDPTTSLLAAPVKTAGEAFVVDGTAVGMLVDIIIILLVLIGMLLLIIMLMLMLMLIELLMPGIGSIAAAALYASSVLLLPSFSLMTMAIPFWQCPICPQ